MPDLRSGWSRVVTLLYALAQHYLVAGIELLWTDLIVTWMQHET